MQLVEGQLSTNVWIGVHGASPMAGDGAKSYTD